MTAIGRQRTLVESWRSACYCPLSTHIRHPRVMCRRELGAAVERNPVLLHPCLLAGPSRPTIESYEVGGLAKRHFADRSNKLITGTAVW